CSVLRSLRTWHAEKQHAREPGDLLHALVARSRPVREGHKPNGGHERAGEVGLCRSTDEPTEQGGADGRPYRVSWELLCGMLLAIRQRATRHPICIICSQFSC